MDVFTARWHHTTGWSLPLPAWDGPGTLVLVFGRSDLAEDDAPLRAIVDAFPTSAMLGCSTSGEILGEWVYEDSITVSVTRFERTTLAVEVEPVSRPQSADAGRSVGRRLLERGGDLAAIFVLGDGMDISGSALARGLTEGSGASAVISGGLAGDGNRFERTWVLVDGRPRQSYLTAVGLYGTALEVGTGWDGGWLVLGPRRVITRSEGNVLLELDGRPALELYKEYLGERAAGLPATAMLFPLALPTGAPDESAELDDRMLVRIVLAVDESRQSMTFTDDIPQGSAAQLMRGTTERLVDAAQLAAATARLPGDDTTLAILVSCIGRRMYLGQRVEEELEAAKAELGPAAHLVGFYSYGELAPLSAGSCALHNMTMTITVLRERPE
ncbi:MAG TPA: FIST N-terminal domain-containing protein [Dermatophilaceae bacterium]